LVVDVYPVVEDPYAPPHEERTDYGTRQKPLRGATSFVSQNGVLCLPPSDFDTGCRDWEPQDLFTAIMLARDGGCLLTQILFTTLQFALIMPQGYDQVIITHWIHL
jgi:hypothetical protein